MIANQQNLLDELESRFGKIQDVEFHSLFGSDGHTSIRVATSDCHTIFTAGMSDRAMVIPDEFSEYQFAELFIQLPLDWKLDNHSVNDLKYSWPIDCMRKISSFPFQHGCSLGGPVMVLPNDSPDETFSSDCSFCGMLLIAEHKLNIDEKLIQLYRMMPLYWEEVLLDRLNGTATLLNKLDAEKIPFVVNPHRQNVGL